MYKNRMNTIMFQLEEVERERDQVEHDNTLWIMPFMSAINGALIVYIYIYI